MSSSVTLDDKPKIMKGEREAAEEQRNKTKALAVKKSSTEEVRGSSS